MQPVHHEDLQHRQHGVPCSATVVDAGGLAVTSKRTALLRMARRHLESGKTTFICAAIDSAQRELNPMQCPDMLEAESQLRHEIGLGTAPFQWLDDRIEMELRQAGHRELAKRVADPSLILLMRLAWIDRMIADEQVNDSAEAAPVKKSVVTVTILHPSDETPAGMALGAIAERIDSGPWLGQTSVATVADVPCQSVGDECRQLGNDGDFFEHLFGHC